MPPFGNVSVTLSPASVAPSVAQSSLLDAATPPAKATIAGGFYSVTHGPAGTSAQAGHDRRANGGRVARLVALCAKVSTRLFRRVGGADGAGADVGHIIGRRAERLNNRNRTAADRYVTVHTVLARGRA